MSNKKTGLGRGLDAIFLDNQLDTNIEDEALKISISDIEPNRGQPRTNFNSDSISELADSIIHHGVLQPLIVRPVDGGYYQIVAGERRWRACKMAGITEVPVIVRELDDVQVMQLALIENLQREDLSIIEEAKGYKTLMDKYNLTQEEVSKSVGKPRPSVTNALRLLSLPDGILDMIENNKISHGHAKVLLSLKDQDEMIKAAELVCNEGLSVRQLEKIVQRSLDNNKKSCEKSVRKRCAFFDEVEISLKEHLGRKVKITGSNEKKGILQIEFYNEEDLTQLARLIGG